MSEDEPDPDPPRERRVEVIGDRKGGPDRRDNIIECDDIVVKFGDQVVLDHLTLNVKRGERLVILGGSAPASRRCST